MWLMVEILHGTTLFLHPHNVPGVKEFRAVQDLYPWGSKQANICHAYIRWTQKEAELAYSEPYRTMFVGPS